MISHYRWAATGNLNQMKMTFIDSLGLLHPRKTSSFPVPETLLLGTGIELLKGLGIVWGWDQLKFWGFLGFIPEFPRFLGLGTGTEPLKTLGMLRGWGTPKYRGFFGEKSPKISEFRGGGGGKNLGDFPTTSTYQGRDDGTYMDMEPGIHTLCWDKAWKCSILPCKCPFS